MKDLTENILALDANVASLLKSAKMQSDEAKRDADESGAEKIKILQKKFEEERKREKVELSKTLMSEIKDSKLKLEKKMKAFEASLDQDAAIDELVKRAKERICP